MIPESWKRVNKKPETTPRRNPCGGARSAKGGTMKENTKPYFSHDADAGTDPKILKLRLKHGVAGYGVFWLILEEMRRQTDYRLEKDFESLALMIRESNPELVRGVIEDFGLFQTDENGKIYSESFLKRMDIKDAKSETHRINGRRGGLASKGQAVVKQGLSDGQAKISKDKDKDKDKINITSTNVEVSSVPSTESTEPPPPECVLTEFSLELNTGDLYRLPQTEYEQFVKNFPGVDVSAELRKMESWCHTNKENRKTRKGILRFVNRWLGSAQDKSRPTNRPPVYAGRPKTNDSGFRQEETIF